MQKAFKICVTGENERDCALHVVDVIHYVSGEAEKSEFSIENTFLSLEFASKYGELVEADDGSCEYEACLLLDDEQAAFIAESLLKNPFVLPYVQILDSKGVDFLRLSEGTEEFSLAEVAVAHLLASHSLRQG